MTKVTERHSSKTAAKIHLRKWMLRHAKFGIVTIIIGIIFFIMLMILHNTNTRHLDEYLWGALISLPVTILCMGTFSVFYEWYLRNNFTNAMRPMFDSWNTGVHVLPSHKGAPDRLEELLKAKKSVKLMSTTFSQYFANVGGKREIEAKIKNENVKFKFIIYEPGSIAVDEKAFEENATAKKFNDEIISTCNFFLGPLIKKYPRNVKVRFCPFNTPFGITIIDEIKMILSLNIYGLVREKNETPCLIIDNKYESDSVFKLYDKAFDAIWLKLNDSPHPSVEDFFK